MAMVINEEQQMLKESAQGFLARICTGLRVAQATG